MSLAAWLQKEAISPHTNSGENNPHASAFSGGLHPDGTSYLDIRQYLIRFGLYYNNAHGNPRVLLLGSQALGRHVNSARALVSHVLQHYGMAPNAANAASVARLSGRCQKGSIIAYPFPEYEPFDAHVFWAAMGEGTITPIAAAIDAKAPHYEVLDRAETLLDQSAGVFIGFTAMSGVLAQPGLPNGEVSSL